MEGSACTGCPETLLGGAERKGRGISKGYFCLYFLRLIHLGPKARHVLPAARDTAGPPLSPGGWGRGGGAYIVFFSITLLEPRARLFPAVLSRGTQLAAAPEEGAATGPPHTHTSLSVSSQALHPGRLPLVGPGYAHFLWGAEAREGGGGAKGTQRRQFSAGKQGGWLAPVPPEGPLDRKPEQPGTLFIGLPSLL